MGSLTDREGMAIKGQYVATPPVRTILKNVITVKEKSENSY
jgi:hypothetical protein